MSTSGKKNRDAVLAYIEEYQEENLRAPTIREIQLRCGFKSPRAVSYILERLEENKAIIRRPQSRGLLVNKPQRKGSVELPFFSSIPAGYPSVSEANHAETLVLGDVATFGIKNPKLAFALRVSGESMKDAGILSGDTVILEQKDPKSGDIVAALSDGGSTLKRLVVKDNGQVFLKAENAQFPNIVPSHELEVQGVVVGVLRKVA